MTKTQVVPSLLGAAVDVGNGETKSFGTHIELLKVRTRVPCAMPCCVCVVLGGFRSPHHLTHLSMLASACSTRCGSSPR